jgi:hypothetical protein
MKNAYKILVEKPEENRPLRRLRHILEDNIKVHLRKIVIGDVDWIHVA